jgi:hypothetical protein
MGLSLAQNGLAIKSAAALWIATDNAHVARMDSGMLPNRHNRPIGAHFHSGGAKFPYLGEDLYEAFG